MPSAARVKGAKLRVAAVSVAALSILGVLVYLLSGSTLFQAKTTLRTVVDDSTGLGEGLPVRMNGIQIGKIEWIRLSGSRDPNRAVELVLVIERKYLHQIPEDSTSNIASDNLLGERYIDIDQGKSSRPARPGSELSFRPARELLKRIDLVEFEIRLRAIDGLLRDIEAGKGSIGRFVRGDEMYRTALAKVTELEKRIASATDTSQRLGSLLYGSLRYDELQAPLLRLDARLAEVQAGRGPAGRFLRDPGQYAEWSTRIAGIRHSLAELNAGRGQAGRFLQSEEAWSGWGRRLAGLIQAVDAFNAGQQRIGYLFTSSQPYDNVTGATRELQSTLRDFRRDPRKFLRIHLGLF